MNAVLGCCADDDGGDEDDGGVVLDPYLEAPTVRCSVHPTVLYVGVPALPRAALLEVQPLLVDVDGVSAKRRVSGGLQWRGRWSDRGSSRAQAACVRGCGAQGQGVPCMWWAGCGLGEG